MVHIKLWYIALIFNFSGTPIFIDYYSPEYFIQYPLIRYNTGCRTRRWEYLYGIRVLRNDFTSG